MPQVFLFDLDGTLIRVNKAGREAFQKTLSVLFSCETVESFSFTLRGVTDSGVFKEFCRHAGVPFTIELWARFLFLFKHHLARIAPSFRWEIIPGVKRLLEYCLKYNIAAALVTGNTIEGARIKLTRAGLPLSILKGGFGDNADTKKDSAKEALHLFPHISAEEFLFFGDTMSDYEAASFFEVPFIGLKSPDFSKEASAYPFPVITSYDEILQEDSSGLLSYDEMIRKIPGKEKHTPL
jgi:phosphoglycolate phosphatase-like HAD superfamily hydrolase